MFLKWISHLTAVPTPLPLIHPPSYVSSECESYVATVMRQGSYAGTKKRRINKSGSYSRMESPLSPFPSSLKLLLACLWSIWHKTTDFHSNYDMRVTRSRHFHKLPSKMPWQITQNNINDSKRVRLALFFCRRATLFCFVCLTKKMQTNCLPKTLDKFHLPFWFVCYDERRRRKKNTMEIRLSRRPIWWSARNLFSFSQIYSRFGTNRWIWVFYQTYWLNHCWNWWRWKWNGSTPFSCHRHYRILWLLIIANCLLEQLQSIGHAWRRIASNVFIYNLSI